MCIYDAFKSYRDEAEQNESHEFPLYHWTKSTIEDPLKQQNHQNSFTRYLGHEQVYSKALAIKLTTT